MVVPSDNQLLAVLLPPTPSLTHTGVTATKTKYIYILIYSPGAEYKSLSSFTMPPFYLLTGGRQCLASCLPV